MDRFSDYGTGINVINKNIVVALKADLDDQYMRQVQNEVLDKIKSRTVKGVLLDISRVKIIDSIIWKILTDTSKMVKLLGCRAVFVGLGPGPASALVDLDLDLDAIETARTVDDAIELIESAKPETTDNNGINRL